MKHRHFKWMCNVHLSAEQPSDPKTYNASLYEPSHDKTNKMAYASTEDSDQPGHPPSLISVFVVSLMGS